MHPIKGTAIIVQFPQFKWRLYDHIDRRTLYDAFPLIALGEYLDH